MHHQTQTSAEFRQRADILKENLSQRSKARETVYQYVMLINDVLLFVAALLAFSKITWIFRM
ncbi:hypothetical protein Ocin01_15480 [Orchesella cincta]|uniref:Uncharacterized protein n=1 Tax=Orchesella cincta TaxID=48709 RepID=A0A1D2ME68_ORCCI|nr:hypothetical protein Ocin01_15480 [Orchesella cincta]